MKRLWRAVQAAGMWYLVLGALGILMASAAHVGPLGGASIVLPAPGPSYGQYETAWHPYREVDSSGAWALCVANTSGRIWAPYIDTSAVPPTPSTAPAVASNPPHVGGAL